MRHTEIRGKLESRAVEAEARWPAVRHEANWNEPKIIKKKTGKTEMWTSDSQQILSNNKVGTANDGVRYQASDINRRSEQALPMRLTTGPKLNITKFVLNDQALTI